jgi:hypothetical protein
VTLDVMMEEMILRNTYLNAQMGPIAQYGPLSHFTSAAYQKKDTLTWTDQVSNGSAPLAFLLEVSTSATANSKITSHKRIKSSSLKSSLKVKTIPFA